MFAIYSYMFTSGLTSAQELSTFIGYGLTEAQYKQIVGDNKATTTQAQDTQQTASQTL